MEERADFDPARLPGEVSASGGLHDQALDPGCSGVREPGFSQLGAGGLWALRQGWRRGSQHPLQPASTGVERLVQQRPAAAVAQHIEQDQVRGSGRYLAVQAAPAVIRFCRCVNEVRPLVSSQARSSPSRRTPGGMWLAKALQTSAGEIPGQRAAVP